MPTTHGQSSGPVRLTSPGFTLIELLVVIAIVGLLVGILLPALAKSRDAARSATCLARLHNLHVSMRLYADHYRTFPVAEQNDVLADLEMPNAVWKCPSDREHHASSPNQPYSSYTYLAPLYMDPPPISFSLAQLKPVNALRKYENNPKLPLFWDREAWHGRDRNIVYWNGSAQRKDW